jgi:hypothetical protein
MFQDLHVYPIGRFKYSREFQVIQMLIGRLSEVYIERIWIDVQVAAGINEIFGNCEATQTSRTF